MIGIDTNVLLRLATDDDPRQVKAITRWLADNASDLPLYVNHVVLAEALWTLKTSYGYTRGQQITFLEMLLGNTAFNIEEEGQVEIALHHFANTKADFPDCLIFAKNAHICRATLSFDRETRGLSGSVVL